MSNHLSLDVIFADTVLNSAFGFLNVSLIIIRFLIIRAHELLDKINKK